MVFLIQCDEYKSKLSLNASKCLGILLLGQEGKIYFPKS